MSVFKSDPSSSEDESQEERVHFKMSNKRSFSYIDAEDSESEPKKMHRNGAFSSHKFISGHSADDGEDEILSFNRSMEFPSKAGGKFLMTIILSIDYNFIRSGFAFV